MNRSSAPIAVLIQCSADLRDLASANRALNFRCCNSLTDVERVFGDAMRRTAVLELTSGVAAWLSQLELLAHNGCEINLLIRAPLNASASRLILGLPLDVGSIRLSFQQFDSIALDVVDMLRATPAPTADVAILGALRDRIPESAAQLACATVRLGRHRSSVRQLADACSVSVRTLEWRFRHYGLPAARSALRSVLAINALWRLQILNWPIKRVASASGFRDRVAFTNTIRRECGVAPATWRRLEMFSDALHRVSNNWHPESNELRLSHAYALRDS